MNKSNKRGRPKKDPADKRSEVLIMRLTPIERGLIVAAFKQPSVAVRELALQEVRRRLPQGILRKR